MKKLIIYLLSFLFIQPFIIAQKAHIIIEKGKYGIEGDNKYLLKPKYDSIITVDSDDSYLVKKNQRYAICNLEYRLLGSGRKAKISSFRYTGYLLPNKDSIKDGYYRLYLQNKEGLFARFNFSGFQITEFIYKKNFFKYDYDIGQLANNKWACNFYGGSDWNNKYFKQPADSIIDTKNYTFFVFNSNKDSLSYRNKLISVGKDKLGLTNEFTYDSLFGKQNILVKVPHYKEGAIINKNGEFVHYKNITSASFGNYLINSFEHYGIADKELNIIIRPIYNKIWIEGKYFITYEEYNGEYILYDSIGHELLNSKEKISKIWGNNFFVNHKIYDITKKTFVNNDFVKDILPAGYGTFVVSTDEYSYYKNFMGRKDSIKKKYIYYVNSSGKKSENFVKNYPKTYKVPYKNIMYETEKNDTDTPLDAVKSIASKNLIGSFLAALLVVPLAIASIPAYALNNEGPIDTINLHYYWADQTNVSPNFFMGLARVAKTDKKGNISYGYIDTTLSPIIPCKYEFATDFSSGIAIVKQKKYGLIDYKNHSITGFIYDSCGFYAPNLYIVKNNNNPENPYFFIDNEGKKITSIPNFSSYYFENKKNMFIDIVIKVKQKDGEFINSIVLKDGSLKQL